MTRKKALLLGGTGALGVYLAPQLVRDGFDVTITSRSDRSGEDHIRYIKGDALSDAFLSDLLATTEYDVVVDFMVYSTPQFTQRHLTLLQKARHYVFVSSYRVFANKSPITENTPQLLDVSEDTEFLFTTDYSLEKARQEDILQAAQQKNWTIVRPSITYSKERFQLGTLEADSIVPRALLGVPTVLPREMLEKRTTMTWAGDVARMIAALCANKKAFGEDFNVATNEHHTWREVAALYEKAINLRVVAVSGDQYLAAMGGGYAKYQIEYDRMFDREIDNSKILSFAKMRENELMRLNEGLSMELDDFIANGSTTTIDYEKQGRIDRLVGARMTLKGLTRDQKIAYIRGFSRFAPIINGLFLGEYRKKMKLKQRIRSGAGRIKRALRPKTRLKDALEKQRIYRRTKRFNRPQGGIITLIDYNNYGNILQRYALQEFLLQGGHPFVSYDHELPIKNDLADGRLRFTAEFVRRHVYVEQLPEVNTLNTYIVGSDQIWRDFSYDKPKEKIGFFFLNFLGKSDARRVAYAASFGRNSLAEAKITPEISDYLEPLAKRFDAISVRELQAKKMVEDAWGVKATTVIDPTLLLEPQMYSRLIQRSVQDLTPVNGVYAYLIGVTEENEQLLNKAVVHTGKDLYRIDLADYSGPLPPVEQWLLGLRDAELAVIDSFHGAVFSVLNNTNFVVLENKGSGMERMVNLLNLFGIEGRIIKHSEVSSFSFEDLKPIDWPKVNAKLEKLRAESAEWLLKAIASK